MSRRKAKSWPFEAGEVVWVAIGNSYEEPAKVVQCGCTFEETIVVESNGDRSSTCVLETSGRRSDGVLVQLNVSRIKGIYAPEKLRKLGDDGEVAEGRNSRRGSKRTSTNDTESQSQHTPGLSGKGKGKGKGKGPPRARITPSPTNDPTLRAGGDWQEEESGGEDAAEKRASKRARVGRSKGKVVSAASKASGRRPASKKTGSASVASSQVSSRKKYHPKVLVVRESDSESFSAAGPESDEDEDDDKPFTVEYAPTSRSTCRRCDEVIKKDSIRVSHVPLFRGKPGFRVYRHLGCAVFSEDITSREHVGGWRKLKRTDLEALDSRIQESLEEVEQENKELEPNELVQVAFSGEIRKSPPGLSASLLNFQVEGTSWMYNQEVNVPDIRGGLLADEMGMGKTIQTIATILDNRPKLQHSRPGAKHPPAANDLELRIREEQMWSQAMKEWKHELDMNRVPKNIRPKKLAGARAGTLVVCPVIALSQWKSEIEKFTEDGALSVGIYHGPNRAAEIPAEKMKKYDVIITTYQVIEQDFRKMVSPNKVSCPNCGGKFKIDKLRVHLKYFCGDGAQRTAAQSRQRRTADRPGRGSSKPRSSGGGKKKTKIFPRKPARGRDKIRKKLHVKSSSALYDSDSELSVESVVEDSLTRQRPSRAAAVVATRKVSASMKEWGVSVKSQVLRDDESSFDSGSCEDSSDEEGTSSSSGPSAKRNAPKSSTFSKSTSDESSSSSSESSDSGSTSKSSSSTGIRAQVLNKRNRRTNKSSGKHLGESGASGGDIRRAVAKQEKALARARINSSSKKRKQMPMTKGKGKKFESESDSSEDEGTGGDPMDDIDMDALVAEAMAGSRFSLLHSFCWWRIVLDEAHFIKSRSSQTAAAAFALTSIHRWCLSGTPLQNRVGELYSLVRFLRLDPMALYFCRQNGCSCRSLHYRFENGKCLDCGHRPFSHYAHFNKHVLNPIQRDGYCGDGRRAMFRLKSEVLDTCLLRRTKETKAEDMNLPPRLVEIRSIRLHPVEEDFYNALYSQTKSSFDDYVAEGTLLNNYAHIFDLLTKMRQAVDHPYLIIYSKRNLEKNRGSGGKKVANGSVDCDMCHEPPTDQVVSTCCGAGFCRGCVIEYLTGSVGANTPCPSCDSPFSIDLNQTSVAVRVDDSALKVPSDAKSVAGGPSVCVPSLKEIPHVASGSILRRIDLAEFATSSKIEVLIQELIAMRKKRPGSKALVFSQFVNMLDLVRWRLHSDPCLADLGLGVRILHGGMDVKSRDAALTDFREDNSCRVLLMSLKAAGVALNLTVASEVFVMDLWWNPAAELQAIDRAHRLGQYRPIRAVRFVAEGTVEERVLQLQEKKRLVFDGTIGRDAGSLKMLSVDDMVSLFS